MFGLRKTLGSLFKSNQTDEAWFDALEESLILSDVGLPTTEQLISKLRKAAKSEKASSPEDLKQLLIQEVASLLQPLEPNPNPLYVHDQKTTPEVWLVIGVNGAGKTTTIGKLCKLFQSQGKSVLLAAGDTFRAAARNQLLEWGGRNQVDVIMQESGDAAAVAHDAIHAAISRKSDILIIDTAGRLATQDHLMEELKKVKRVIGKALPGAPHQTLLVLDGNTGQNGLSQVKAFHAALGLSALIVTKLDGTAKGGVICALAHTLNDGPKPAVLALGKGEGIDDLAPFTAAQYSSELFN
ncbi:MAG: signal recognition particle-docking protein FtsY [Polynucleobacter sp. 24-46-87]|jgi:fused signal recognition particle receptor|uniref:signal recognition particle-docking protein FtsY n=1 Tax=unclassified Polynucleobacter TaxID=2640945 RepID=UPI000BD91E5D|nr:MULTISPECIES: signal recognition particle-docking protein FtsY [unclassified Polynucleobacter]OYY21880.1 MAG: signal recognition particle-docking protein FtsY [Polynucleobacter sp. 35-46-11]OZA16094.1 MAG: signal recognition particle-docking protein FtsY [Polynucleobacter sp. 24-46-87]OZA77459.1 MAG: signal recognition particle-docking protein FtsY [Polynucleobacter sp. 39-46-10]